MDYFHLRLVWFQHERLHHVHVRLHFWRMMKFYQNIELRISSATWHLDKFLYFPNKTGSWFIKLIHIESEYRGHWNNSFCKKKSGYTMYIELNYAEPIVLWTLSILLKLTLCPFYFFSYNDKIFDSFSCPCHIWKKKVFLFFLHIHGGIICRFVFPPKETLICAWFLKITLLVDWLELETKWIDK